MEPDNEMSKVEAPMSNEVLAVHVDYLRQDVKEVLREMLNMATKSDVEKISARMDKFVTQDQFDVLEKKVDSGTISSSFSKITSFITKLASAIAALAAMFGMIAAIVHFSDKFK